ncbi:MAG: siphovirus Gp157 family protein [Lacrimispora sphenoides]
MSTIYEITDDVLALMQMMEEDSDNEVIKDTLEALNGELDIKAESYCKVIAEFKAKEAALISAIESLTQKKQSVSGNIDRLKIALFGAMKATGKEKIKGDLFYLYIKNNAESLDQVPEKLPEKYLIPQEPKIDRKQLLADVKTGVVVDGVTTKRTQSLIIK